jgi:hypothetical protein
MFRRASRKLGLSQAVFETGGIRRTFNDKEEEPNQGGLVNLLKLDKDKVHTCALMWSRYLVQCENTVLAGVFLAVDLES